MKHIVLTSEQMRVVLDASEPIEVRDQQGRTVAQLAPLQPEDVEAIEHSKRNRGVGGPRIPSDQVQAHLLRLEQIQMHEGMDEAKMLDTLRRLRAGEQA